MKIPVSFRCTALQCALAVTTVSLLFAGCGKDEGGSKTPADKTAPVDTIPGKDAPAGKNAGKDVPQAKSRGPEHALYSLADNRLSAHVQRGGGLVAIGGSAGFVKYMRFRKSALSWKIRAEKDGAKVAVMDGKTGRVDVPLTAEQAAGPLRMRVYNDKARALSIRINGAQKSEISQQMEAGWSTISIDVPAGLLRAGENEIILFTGPGEPMALAWLQVGGQTFGDDTPVIYEQAGGNKGLVLPRGGGLSYHVMVPDKGLVTGDLNDAACKVEVTATADGGAQVKGELFGKGSAVALGKLAGKPVRLDLFGKDCDTAHLAGAALVVPGPAPVAKRQGTPPKYVVLWIMDSLRADRVRPFNPKARPETPTFERLGKDGAVFTQAYVQGNESRVSHASLWSALYPVKHNMLAAKAKLDGKWTTIDEVAKSAGMFASGVSANGYVAKKWGFGNSWDAFKNHIHEGGGLKGEDVLENAVASVEGKNKPWFLYIGTIDTHVSWRPKEPWIKTYHPEPYSGRFAKRFSGEDAGKGDKLGITKPEIEWVRALYDSNVSYQDDLLRQLLEKLDAWGIADETMIVITADHGDEQWEDGRVGHGGSVRDSLVHVPLLIHYPAMVPARVVDEGVDVLDVMPTVADVLGVTPDDEWQGASLLPLAHGVGAGYPRMSFASQYEGTHAARIGPWKLRAPGSADPDLYNMASDPEERTDMTVKNPIAYRLVADPMWLMRAYNAEWKKSVWGNAANVEAAFPEHFAE